MNTTQWALIAVVALAVGLGVGYFGASSSITPAAPTTTTVTPTPVTLTLVTEGHEGGIMGPDGKSHDTVMPANFTVHVGQPVTLNVLNFDEGPHSITSTGLNVNFQYPGQKAPNVPSVTTFTFTPTKAGVYRWNCITPCDGGQGGWAMAMGPDGGVGQPGFMAGYITVLA